MHSIRWRIAVPYVALILLAMTGLFFYLSGLVREIELSTLRSQLSNEARLIGDALAARTEWDQAGASLDDAARSYAALLDARVTLIAADGVVRGESDEDRAQMDNHLYRPEVQAALTSGVGSSIRYSRTVDREMMYVAVALRADGQLRGVVRLALPLDQVDASVGRLRGAVLSATLLAALASAAFALLIAGRIAQPLRNLTAVVQRMAGGDLGARLLPTTRDEVGQLTAAYNQMADRLRVTIVTLTDERGRLAAVLENMADGALITDIDGRVELINPAAARFLDTDADTALGQSFAAVARDHRIIDLWRQCREQTEESVDVVDVARQGPFLQVVVTPLWDSDPRACLVVFQDLTRVRRLEAVRRDFVSNVSHELRTPLASLKALVETLRDGALEDPEAAGRFLDRMETEVDALTQMVRELLELARIESGQAPFRLAPVAAAEFVLPPVERLRVQAERAGLTLTVDVPDDLPAVLADVERMQQVVTNLVHNAIKFTPAGGRIEVRAVLCEEETRGRGEKETRGQGDKEMSWDSQVALSPERQVTLSPSPLVSLSPCLLVTIRDTGVGIPADDLERIFERFYKADRARSDGGTGLGLAIAKHIVQAHGGQIWATSREGAGSTFTVALPLAT